MKIKVNNREIEIFSGALVKDALQKFSGQEWLLIQKNEKAVYDRHGHEIAGDGELTEGQELFVKAKDK